MYFLSSRLRVILNVGKRNLLSKRYRVTNVSADNLSASIERISAYPGDNIYDVRNNWSRIFVLNGKWTQSEFDQYPGVWEICGTPINLGHPMMIGNPLLYS